LIIVVPENQRVAPQEHATKRDDDESGGKCAKEISPRINTDVHGYRKTDSAIRVSSVCIRGQEKI
jgi:hypothetical protein